MTSQYETNLWSTHINIVRLAEPITRCVRWRTQVFKIEGLVCKRFLPSPLPSFIFWLSFHFPRGQNRKYRSSVFFCSETKRKRLLRRLRNTPHKRCQSPPPRRQLWRKLSLFSSESWKSPGWGQQGHPKPHPVPEKLRANTTMGKGERLNQWKLNIFSTVSCSRNFLPNRYFSRKKKVSQQISPDTDWQKSQE